MKVKKMNNASKRTNEAIKIAFAKLLQEKKELQYITVTELVKRAQITRSSFYTHFDNIYDVAKEFQNDTMELFSLEDYSFHSLEDAYHYIDSLLSIIKENEEIYRMLLSSNEPLIFLERIRTSCIQMMYSILKEKNSKNTLKLDIEFFVDGIMSQFLKYFRTNEYCTLEELSVCIKSWLQKVFF